MAAGLLLCLGSHHALKPLRQRKDCKADWPADKRAVDADILQVGSDLQLYSGAQRRSIPILHDLADEGGDLRPAWRHRAQNSNPQPSIDPVTDPFSLRAGFLHHRDRHQCRRWSVTGSLGPVAIAKVGATWNEVAKPGSLRRRR